VGSWPGLAGFCTPQIYRETAQQSIPVTLFLAGPFGPFGPDQKDTPGRAWQRVLFNCPYDHSKNQTYIAAKHAKHFGVKDIWAARGRWSTRRARWWSRMTIGAEEPLVLEKSRCGDPAE
jgi:hypothetical protein